MIMTFWQRALDRDPNSKWEDINLKKMDLKGAYTLLSFHPEDVGLFGMEVAGVGRNGCIALHYYVHFLRIFSFVTRGIESEGIGHHSVCVMPNPLAKTWDSNSGSQSMYATFDPTSDERENM